MSCEDHSLLKSFMDVYENLHGLCPSGEYRLFALSCADPEGRGGQGPDPPEKSQKV